MIVTLDIFSGLPNPSWTLSPKDAKELVARLAGKAMMPVDAGPTNLGFRGYIVAAQSDDEAQAAGLPDVFRVGGGTSQHFVTPQQAQESTAIGGDESRDAAHWLLGTAGEAVGDELLGIIKEDIEGAKKGAGPLDTEVMAAAPCVIQNTPYNPGFWNVPSVQPYNNCYNYAMNYRSNTFAQPGRISGHPNAVMQCPNVAAAANYDGCTAICSGPNKNVALVVWPGFDYHWYRLHSNGFWGHKPGSTPARNTDEQGRVIGGALNPQNCNRGHYTNFCGYRFSPVGMKVK
jgi:hypothetical protein